MKPAVVVLSTGKRPKPPICPWFIDNPGDPPRQKDK